MEKMILLIDKTALINFIFFALTLGLAPFTPPHIYEKLIMIKNKTLKKPLDIFDLCFHTFPWLLLFIKLGRMATA